MEKKICIIGAGHAFNFQYRALQELGYNILVCDIDEEKLKGYEKTISDYRDIPDDYNLVLVSTPPKTHHEIIKYLYSRGKKVISEKPLVINLAELNDLEENNSKFYNILHYSFGDEIEWFINSEYRKKKPNKIKFYINDPYVKDNHIMDEKIPLNGSYLDETINPLSAIKRIYKEDIHYLDVKKLTYAGDKYDYAAEAKFEMGSILIEAYIHWNDYGDRSKYIDIYYDDEIIRLDSINRSVINLTNKEVLYKNEEDRMYKHYLNAFRDYEINIDNSKDAIILNREILRGA